MIRVSGFNRLGFIYEIILAHQHRHAQVHNTLANKLEVELSEPSKNMEIFESKFCVMEIFLFQILSLHDFCISKNNKQTNKQKFYKRVNESVKGK